MITLGAALFSLVFLSPQSDYARNEFLEANKELAFHLGRCIQYQEPGLRDRLVLVATEEKDAFRAMVLRAAIPEFEEGLRQSATAQQTQIECDEKVGGAIARTALADRYLIGVSGYTPLAD